MIHRRIASQYDRLFKSLCFKDLRLFIYLRTTVVEYLGRADLKLETPFKNLRTKGNSPNGISFSVLIIVDKTDLAVFTDE